MNVGRWSRKEDEWLIANYRNYSNSEIADILDRRVKSIETRAAKLGLRKREFTRRGIQCWECRNFCIFAHDHAIMMYCRKDIRAITNMESTCGNAERL